MITTEPLEERHLCGFMPNPSQGIDISEEDMFSEFSKSDGGVWAFIHHGKVIGVGGLIPIWQGRAMAWMVMEKRSGPAMIALTRFLPHFIDAHGFQRVEMWVSAGFEVGFRWALQLGFELETPRPMRKYLADGGDAYLFSRCV